MPADLLLRAHIGSEPQPIHHIQAIYIGWRAGSMPAEVLFRETSSADVSGGEDAEWRGGDFFWEADDVPNMSAFAIPMDQHMLNGVVTHIVGAGADTDVTVWRLCVKNEDLMVQEGEDDFCEYEGCLEGEAVILGTKKAGWVRSQMNRCLEEGSSPPDTVLDDETPSQESSIDIDDHNDVHIDVFIEGLDVHPDGVHEPVLPFTESCLDPWAYINEMALSLA